MGTSIMETWELQSQNIIIFPMEQKKKSFRILLIMATDMWKWVALQICPVMILQRLFFAVTMRKQDA